MSDRRRCTTLALALLAGGCAAAPSVPPAVSLTEGSRLSPRDGIEGLDVAVDAGGSVHVVWQELVDQYGELRGTRLVYRHGVGTPLRWEPPVVLATGRTETGNPQVVATTSGVHVVAGGHLHHWWLPTKGGAMRDAGDLLHGQDVEAGPFDMAPDADGVLVLFAGLRQGQRRAIEAMRWTPAGPQASRAIAAWTDARGTTPRLVKEGDRWQAFWATNALVEYRDPRFEGATASRMEAGVWSATSLDDGVTWGPETRATPALPTDVVAIAAAEDVDAPTVFFAANGLFVSRVAAGASTPPMRIAAYEPGALAGSADTSAVATAQCKGRTALAWVDARDRRSDRRWWNPLGGFPWGDNPDWINNDVFVATRAPRDAAQGAALSPVRLTRPGSMTRDIAIAARDGQLLVLRSGRSRVRKAPYDEGAPPEVLQTVVPCS